ncbi:MAG: DNA internalization-related competence protein ComEC/Rec2 [Thermoanaerobaculia bacterium]
MAWEARGATCGRGAPWRTAPACVPAVLFLGAVAWGASAVLSPLAVLSLLAAALATGGRARPVVAALALGLLTAVVAVPGRPPTTGRPVDLVASPEGPWRRQAFGWVVPVRARRYRQGLEVRPWTAEVRVWTDGARAPAPARRLRLRGYVARRSASASPGAHGERPWTMVVHRRLLTVEEPEGRVRRALRSARERLDRGLLELGPERPGVRVARALVLGRSDALEEAWSAGLRRLGLAHLTALSGLHVGLVLGLALLALRGLPRPRLRWAIGAVAVAAYVAVAGVRPSLVRAAAMTAALVAGAVAERRTVAWNALALAAVGLVAWRPSWVDDPGLVLSIAATAGLLWGAGRGRGRSGALRTVLDASLCAQLAGAPWVLWWFRVLQPAASLWNLAAAPWLAALLAVSILLTVAGAVGPGAARLVLPFGDLLAAPLAWAALRPPDRLLTLAAPALGTGILLALAALAGWRRSRSWTVVALTLLVWVAHGALAHRAAPELDLLDVGQGTAALLRQGREGVLVDGGGWPAGDVARSVTVPALAGLGLDRLRAVVMTHPDLDHCRGLWQLARAVPVDEIWIGAGWPRSDCLIRLLAVPGPRLRVLLPGDRIPVAGWTVETLHPSPGFGGTDNDRSLVLRAEAGDRAVLLTGDLQAAGERALLGHAPGSRLRADVLLVPHHGSRTSAGPELLDAVRPRLAVISAGPGNRFGHPHREVLERLRRRGIPRLVTARSGWIRVVLPAAGGLRVETPSAPAGG